MANLKNNGIEYVRVTTTYQVEDDSGTYTEHKHITVKSFRSNGKILVKHTYLHSIDGLLAKKTTIPWKLLRQSNGKPATWLEVMNAHNRAPFDIWEKAYSDTGSFRLVISNNWESTKPLYAIK